VSAELFARTSSLRVCASGVPLFRRLAKSQDADLAKFYSAEDLNLQENGMAGVNEVIAGVDEITHPPLDLATTAVEHGVAGLTGLAMGSTQASSDIAYCAIQRAAKYGSIISNCSEYSR
jgi:hypothetical protein